MPDFSLKNMASKDRIETMNSVLETALSQGPVLLDGAWGTQFQLMGLPTGQAADRWNLEFPDRVEAVAQAYIEAGSRVILTNTFQANRFAISRSGLKDRVVELNRSGAAISRRAAGRDVLVFGSVGPTGVMLTLEEVPPEMIRSAFKEQIEGLRDGGVDGIVVETMSDPAEAALAIEAAHEVGLPVIACLCYDSGKKYDRTMMGTTPEEGTRILDDAGADGIGANCGQGIESYVSVCERIRAVTDRPIWIKANAGLPEMVEGKPLYRTTADEFADAALGLVKAGADFVGGCCGTSPEFIRAVAGRIQTPG